MARIRLGNLKGPKGDKGDPGPRGPQGIQGPPGTAENIDLTPFVKKTEGATLTGQYTFTNNTPIKLNGYNIVSENNRILFKNASNNNVFAFDANTITHNDKSLLTQDKANTLYAPIGDYALRTALNSYATTASLSNYLTTSNASTTYLNKTDASNTYAPKTALSSYVTSSTAESTYAKKSDLNGYATTTVLNNYVTTSNANSTYAPKTALNDYVTTSQYNNDMNSLLTALRNVNN